LKLRKLELVGFKSFADPVTLKFDEGTNGIVGPNGCGKSNVVDAIRWVMGEQSAKKLRGKSMEDVIFAGSESKPPMGMAEVSLTLENDGRHLAPEYAAYPEITVTRKIFRSGESEYYINKTPCRLLDVQELFLGTGAGTRAYSIINQGAVGELIAQKPIDRRALIEEAAGISKYNVRKKIAERKMEQTRFNLQRVNDIVTELERNINSLKRQARKAARYRKLKEELRRIELHQAVYRYLELRATRRWLEEKIARLSDSQSESRTRLAALEADIEQRRTALLDGEREIAGEQEKLLNVDNQVRLCQKNLEFLDKEARALEESGQKACLERDRLKAELERVNESLAGAGQELERLEQNARNAAERFGRQDEVCQEFGRKLDLQNQEMDTLRSQLRTTAEEGAALSARLESLEQRLVDSEGRLGQALAEAKALERNLQAAEEKLNEQTEVLGRARQMHLALASRRETSENSLADLEAEFKQGEAQLAALRDEMAAVRSRLESLRQIEKNYEGCLQGVQWVMKHARSEEQTQLDVVGLVADILRAPPRYETAVQAVLGEKLQSIVVSSQQVGLQAVDALKRQAEGRSSFIPLSLRQKPEVDTSGIKGPKVIGPVIELVDFEAQHEPVVKYLLGDAVLVEDLPTALSIWSANGHRATLVTLDGEVLAPEGVLTGGSLEGPGAHLLKHKRQIRELGENLQSLEAAYRLAVDRQGKLRTELATMRASLDSVRQNIHQEELRIIQQQKDVDHLRQQVASLRGQLEKQRAQASRLGEQVEKLRAERVGVQQALSEISARRAQLEQQQTALAESIEFSRRQAAAEAQSAMELKAEAAACAERVEAARERLEHLEAVRRENARRLEQSAADITGANQKLLESKRQMENNREEISRLVVQRQELETRLSQARDGYQQLALEAQRLEGELKQLRARVQESSDQLAELQTRQREIELETMHLAADTRRNHRAEITECLYDFHLLPPPAQEARQEAERLRAAIEQLGEVNPNALEEYEENLKRYDFLTSQARDLNESLEKLEQVILKINRTSRKRFREAFDAINEKFQEVFPRLFNGGSACLRLEEGKDLLEAGVEIVIQPPGKKLQNMEALSGGEKALTAVALLFSIYLVKPTPFCLLDEVDAPLDEANIDRFNRMVDHLSQTSQFVIITHNKRTMEHIGRLYGVTMEEPGVSKIITIKIRHQDGAGDPRHMEAQAV